MTIDRVIKDLKGEYSSPYNNQLVEWLEELKAYRTNEGMSENVYRCGYKFGYNKAVDDFKEELLKMDNSEIPQHCQAEFCEGDCKKCTSEIYKIAEQLKGAKQNEN